jgi:hypothetical protein
MNNWVIAILVFFLVDLLIVLWVVFRRRMPGLRQDQLNYIHSHWVIIIDGFGSNPKQGILDADKLLDYAMSKKGFEGSLGEKLKKGGKRSFSDVNGVWRAHKLRNKVAHELGDIDRGEAKIALRNFKKALNDLGAGL